MAGARPAGRTCRWGMAQPARAQSWLLHLRSRSSPWGSRKRPGSSAVIGGAAEPPGADARPVCRSPLASLAVQLARGDAALGLAGAEQARWEPSSGADGWSPAKEAAQARRKSLLRRRVAQKLALCLQGRGPERAGPAPRVNPCPEGGCQKQQGFVVQQTCTLGRAIDPSAEKTITVWVEKVPHETLPSGCRREEYACRNRRNGKLDRNLW